MSKASDVAQLIKDMELSTKERAKLISYTILLLEKIEMSVHSELFFAKIFYNIFGEYQRDHQDEALEHIIKFITEYHRKDNDSHIFFNTFMSAFKLRIDEERGSLKEAKRAIDLIYKWEDRDFEGNFKRLKAFIELSPGEEKNKLVKYIERNEWSIIECLHNSLGRSNFYAAMLLLRRINDPIFGACPKIEEFENSVKYLKLKYKDQNSDGEYVIECIYELKYTYRDKVHLAAKIFSNFFYGVVKSHLGEKIATGFERTLKGFIDEK